MSLSFLNKKLDPLRKNQKEKNFSYLIREAREILGLKQYKAAEFIGMHKERLKNLESENFVHFPERFEVFGLATLYGLDLENLQKKVEEFVREKQWR